MHLHGFQFRVLERETSPEQLAPLTIDARGRLPTDLGFKDTVLVWPGESVRIAIDFRLPYADRRSICSLPQPRARRRGDDAAGQGRMMARPRRVLLVGGGHSHVEVLRRFALRAGRECRADARLARRSVGLYRHAAGLVAGHYTPAEAQIALAPLR
jgi:hypothetical protein